MREGLYIVRGYKNDTGRKLFTFAGLEKDETVYLEKTDYTESCACCGKTTHWTLCGEYDTAVGTTCLKNLKLEKVEK